MRALLAAAFLLLSPATALAQDYRLQSAAATELQGICNRDRGQLWGASLCGPLIVVDGQTRQAYATQRDGLGIFTLTANGAWVGALPQGVPVANTTVDWGGIRWIMVVGPLPEDAEARRVLIAHEAWHRIQASINLPMQSVDAVHLETERGRYLMRLELRALSTAVLSNGRSRQQALRDALAFRMARHAAFPNAASQESTLDRNEGLASYTGVKLGAGDDAGLFAARTLESYDHHDALARSYAYASGPAYGLLLDEYQPNWRPNLGGHPPADLLVSRVRAQALSARDLQRRAERYGGSQVAAEERVRAEAQRQLIAGLRARFASGPRLELPLGQMQFEYDPNFVTPVEGLGSVYQTLTLRDQWGEFRASQGALITPDFSRLVASAPGAGGLSGPGWTPSAGPWLPNDRGRQRRPPARTYPATAPLGRVQTLPPPYQIMHMCQPSPQAPDGSYPQASGALPPCGSAKPGPAAPLYAPAFGPRKPMPPAGSVSAALSGGVNWSPLMIRTAIDLSARGPSGPGRDRAGSPLMTLRRLAAPAPARSGSPGARARGAYGALNGQENVDRRRPPGRNPGCGARRKPR